MNNLYFAFMVYNFFGIFKKKLYKKKIIYLHFKLFCLREMYGGNSQILVVSIVIDYDRGDCKGHLKKNLFTMKIECVTFI